MVFWKPALFRLVLWTTWPWTLENLLVTLVQFNLSQLRRTQTSSSFLTEMPRRALLRFLHYLWLFITFGCIVNYNNGWSPILLAKCGIACSAIPCQIRSLCDIFCTFLQFQPCPSVDSTSDSDLQEFSPGLVMVLLGLSPDGWRSLEFPRDKFFGQDINGHDSGTDSLEVPTIYKAYTRPM